MSGAAVGGVFVKSFAPADVQAEFQKSRWLCRLGRENGFVAPQPIDFNQVTGALRYDCLPHFATAPELYQQLMLGGARDLDGPVRLISEAGRVLGAIHTSPQSQCTGAPVHWRAQGESGWLSSVTQHRSLKVAMERAPLAVAHGDFGFSNIGLTSNGSFVVFDASPNQYTSWRTWSLEPVYFDLALMTSCLAGRGPVMLSARRHTSRRRLALETFLGSYEERSGIRVDPHLLGMAVTCVFELYAARWRPTKRMSLRLLATRAPRRMGLVPSH